MNDDEQAFRATEKTMLGMAFLRTLNEWKNAGGSDIEVLLALDDFITESIKRASKGKKGHR